LIGFDRFLLFRSGAIGDTLLTLPALDALRRRHPEAEIVLAAHPHYAAPLLDAGRVDAVRDAGSPPFHLLYQAPEPEPDALDQLLAGFAGGALFSRDPEGSLAERLDGRVGGKWALASPFPPSGADMHIADWMRQNLGPLDIDAASIAPPALEPSAASREKAERLLSDLGLHQARMVGIHPGGGGRAKWPPPEVLGGIARDVCEEHGATPLLIQGPADQEAVAAFLAFWGSPLPILQTPELEVVMTALGQMAAYLGGDSGVSHLAALTRVPTLALVGPASHPPQWAPMGERTRWMDWHQPDVSEEALRELKEIVRKGM
jgi:ADP-heptose:LPS heptosyltransferase